MKSKALFLLFVFFLNTVAGFSCAIHMEMKNAFKALSTVNVKEHQHDHAKMNCVAVSKNNSPSLTTKADPCCQGKATSFASIAKLVPQTERVELEFPLVISGFDFTLNLLPLHDLEAGLNYHVPQKRPPTRDIRLIIRSFQI